MSSYSRSHCGRVAVIRWAVFVVLCAAGTLANAQDQPAKVELYAGYSFFYPDTTVHGFLPGGLLPVSSRLESNPRGVGASVTYNFNRWLGMTGDASGHWGSGESTAAHRIDDAAFYNLSIGPKLSYRTHYFSPFVEGLVGGHRLTPDLFHRDDRVGFMGGGGLDLNANRHFALRLIRADYAFSDHHFGSGAAATNVRGVRLQSGAVFLLGGGAPVAPIAFACAASPAAIYPGDPVTITGTPTNLIPKKTPVYSWSSTGGKVSGDQTTTSADTNGLNAGSYTVTGHVTQGPKAGQSADCTAAFTVQAFQPPTVSCSANPTTVKPGDTSTITSSAVSAQNRPLTYSYSASAGQISGSTSTASLATQGAPPGPITVTCTATDDKGQVASATATANVEAPYVPPAPKSQKLCAITFGRDSKRPARVDNEAKACLDDVALNAQRSADAHLVVVGEAGSEAKNGAQLAAQRAVNTKAYLVDEKGIDASRISVRTGPTGTDQVETYLVPAGANEENTITGTTPIDESTFEAQSRTVAPQRRHHRARKSR